MTDHNKQQEMQTSPQELSEEQLQGITGGGWLSNIFTKSKTSSTPTPTSTVSPYHRPTINEVPSGGMSKNEVQRAFDSGSNAVRVEPGTDGYNHAIQLNDQRYRASMGR